MKKLVLPLILIAVVGGMIALFTIGNKAPATNKSAGTAAGEQHFAEQTRTHIQPGTQHEAYNSDLPSSGPHYPEPAPWGVVDPSKVEPDERYIHNEEHGGIWIAYKPDLDPATIEKLKNLYTTLPKSQQFNEVKLVVTPRAKNTHPIQVAAWTYTLNLDQYDEAKITQFYNEHVDKGPELIP